MARIFAFPKKNNEYSEEGNESGSWTYKDRIRSHRMIIFYRVLLGLVLTAAVVAALVIQYQLFR